MRIRAFTLIEVALAIAVGAILLALTVSMFKQYRDGALIQQGKLNLATLKQAMAMYKYRKGRPIPMGYVGTVNSVAANVVSVAVAPIPVTNLPQGSILCFGPDRGITGTVSSVSGSTITLLANPSGPVSPGWILRAGMLGNVDDQCSKLLPVPDPAPTVPGMGLADPWIGYATVRQLPFDLSTLPAYNPGTGFVYNPGDTNDVWGGLYYYTTGNNTNAEVEYVLPDPSPSPHPPASIGYFPGDPPVAWGR